MRLQCVLFVCLCPISVCRSLLYTPIWSSQHCSITEMEQHKGKTYPSTRTNIGTMMKELRACSFDMVYQGLLYGVKTILSSLMIVTFSPWSKWWELIEPPGKKWNKFPSKNRYKVWFFKAVTSLLYYFSQCAAHCIMYYNHGCLAFCSTYYTHMYNSTVNHMKHPWTVIRGKFRGKKSELHWFLTVFCSSLGNLLEKQNPIAQHSIAAFDPQAAMASAVSRTLHGVCVTCNLDNPLIKACSQELGV